MDIDIERDLILENDPELRDVPLELLDIPDRMTHGRAVGVVFWVIRIYVALSLTGLIYGLIAGRIHV